MQNNRGQVKNVIFLGRKPAAALALKFLIEKGIRVKAIVTRMAVAGENEALEKIAKKYLIPIFPDDQPLYEMIEKKSKEVADIDMVISFSFWKKIKNPLILLPRLGCVNFHPAPLPDYKSRAGYNTAILDQRKDYGVSAHFIDSEQFDAGPIIRVDKFPIDSETETAFSLEAKTQIKLLQLFKKVMNLFSSSRLIKTSLNIGGLYLTAKQLEAMKKVDLNKDTPEKIHRMIRAFFFPPYIGAYVEIGGEKFGLVDEYILKSVDRLIHK